MKSIVCILIALVAFTSCQQSHRFADIVYVLDEGLPRDIMMWVDKSVMQLEERLTASAVGDTPNLTNLYGLVLFGSTTSIVRRILGQNNVELSPAQQFSSSITDILNNLQPVGATRDGYAGLDNALNTKWRPSSFRIIIFITNTQRDIVFRNITRNSLITKMVDVQANLNMILNVSILALTPSDGSFSSLPGMGTLYFNQTLTYFVHEGGHGVDSTEFSRVFDTATNSSIVYDYGLFPKIVSSQVYADPTSTSLWEIMPILSTFDNTSTQGQGFTEAFFHSNAMMIDKTVNTKVLCQTCQGNRCFYVPTALVTRDRAKTLCMNRSGKLADIDSQDLLNKLNNLINETVWVNSFQNNVNQCFVMMSTNANQVSCNQLHPPLCEFSRSPFIGC